MAKRSTKKKTKSTTRKKTAFRAAASKKSAARKASGKKRPVRRKSASKTTRKKSTSKKKASTARKTTPRKKSAAKKSSAKKSSSKTRKPASKAGSSKKSSVKATGAKKSSSKSKTSTKTKKKASGGSKRKTLGARSVAEAASEAVADSQGYVYINGRRVRMISTSTPTAAKKPRPSRKVDESVADEAAKKKKVIKTHLTAKELRYYRNLLLIKRAELVGDLSAMEAAALESRGGNLSNLPIHMADIGTDTFDQDFNLGLAENERKHLREIDDALARIANKTYGICQMTGEPIPQARLEAKPWAKYTIEAARKMEGQWPR